MKSDNWKPGSEYQKRLKRRPFITLGVTVLIALLIVGLIWVSLPSVTDVSEERKIAIRNLLGPQPLDIEIVYVSGYKVSTQALSVLESKIRTYSQDGDDREINYAYYQIESSIDTTYSSAEMKYLINNAVGRSEPASSTLYIICVNGESDHKGAVGLNWDIYYIALFEETMEEYVSGSSIPFSLADYESSIIVHEWGHALGLVNKGYKSSIDYEDDAHPGHSTNPRSVMHWAVEYVGVTKAPPTDFGLQEEKDISGLKQEAGLTDDTSFYQALRNSNENILALSLVIVVVAVGISYIWWRWACRANVCKPERGEKYGKEK